LSFNFDKIDPYFNNNPTRRNLTVQKIVTKRLIVYLSRSQGVRRVYNEIEIIKLIRLHLHDDYELYILGHMNAIGTIKGVYIFIYIYLYVCIYIYIYMYIYKFIWIYIYLHIQVYINTIKGLHESWARNAAILSRAKVVLGPHGGAFNYLIWTPPDTHFIEFNIFPDDLNSTESHERLSVRSTFLAAFWAKGGSGKFHIVSPSIMHPLGFYYGNIAHPDDIGYGCLFYSSAYYFISFFFEI
jgi:hypothetical protein